MRQRSITLAFIAGMAASFLAQAASNIATAHADDGHADALRDIARAIENKECK